MASEGYQGMFDELPPDTLHADPETMEGFLARVRSEFGGMAELRARDRRRRRRRGAAARADGRALSRAHGPAHGRDGLRGQGRARGAAAAARGARRRARARARARARRRARGRALRADVIHASACFAAHAPGWEKRVEALPGDVTRPGLGLAPHARERVAAEVTHVIHCAASVEFTLPLAEALAVNTQRRAARARARARVRAARVVRGRLHRLRHAAPRSVRPAASTASRRCSRRCRATPRRSTRRCSRAARTSARLLAETGHPNTYTLTKCLAEHLTARARGRSAGDARAPEHRLGVPHAPDARLDRQRRGVRGLRRDDRRGQAARARGRSEHAARRRALRRGGGADRRGRVRAAAARRAADPARGGGARGRDPDLAVPRAHRRLVPRSPRRRARAASTTWAGAVPRFAPPTRCATSCPRAAPRSGSSCRAGRSEARAVRKLARAPARDQRRLRLLHPRHARLRELDAERAPARCPERYLDTVCEGVSRHLMRRSDSAARRVRVPGERELSRVRSSDADRGQPHAEDACRCRASTPPGSRRRGCVTIWWAMASPRPVPSPTGLVVKNGSKMRSISVGRDAAAVVGDRHDHVIAVRAASPRARVPPGVDGLGRVDDQVQEHLAQLLRRARPRAAASSSYSRSTFTRLRSCADATCSTSSSSGRRSVGSRDALPACAKLLHAAHDLRGAVDALDRLLEQRVDVAQQLGVLGAAPGAARSSFQIASSWERFERTNASGLLISCAMPAASSPTAASRAEVTSWRRRSATSRRSCTARPGGRRRRSAMRSPALAAPASAETRGDSASSQSQRKVPPRLHRRTRGRSLIFGRTGWLGRSAPSAIR